MIKCGSIIRPKKSENSKLPSRKTGCWKVIKIYPFKVNFKIDYEKGNQQVVHHNRLSPMKEVWGADSDCSSDESEPEESMAVEVGIEPVPQPEDIEEAATLNPAPRERKDTQHGNVNKEKYLKLCLRILYLLTTFDHHSSSSQVEW